MKRDDIVRMARDAGFIDADQDSVWITDGFWTRELERFAHLIYEATFRDANIAASRTILDAAVLEEREACAKVCDRMEKESDGVECCKWPTPADCAAAIRERSNP